MVKILNIASFIPIRGLPPENDISLKIYADLKNIYGIESEFVKPVGNIPWVFQFFSKYLKVKKKIFSSNFYFDPIYHNKVNFFKQAFPLQRKIPVKRHTLLPWQYAFYGKALEKILENNKPQLIHAHSLFPDGYYAHRLSKKYHIPYIITLRGVYSERYDTKIGNRILADASYKTTPSFNLYNSLKNRFKIDLLPHGLDDEWFTNKPKKFISGKLRLVTVSRLLEMKNIHLIIKTIPKLISLGVNITYDIIGDGEYKDDLESLVDHLGLRDHVFFHGYRDAEYIRTIYSRSDVFIMLSFPETFGRVYFEAAAQGLYIIGVRNTGAYGHFDSSEVDFIDINENQLIEKLIKINEESFNQKTTLARNKIANYKNSKILRRYYVIFEQVVREDLLINEPKDRLPKPDWSLKAL